MIRRRKPLKRSTKPLRRTPLRRVSNKRRKEGAEYGVKRKAFLEVNQWCGAWRAIVDWMVVNDGPAWQAAPGDVPRSEEVHHVSRRTGTNYLDESTWLAVSAWAHRWIHENQGKARAIGLLR